MRHSNVVAFAGGQVARIALIDHTRQIRVGVSMPKLARAMTRFLRDHFVPVWGTPAEIEVARDIEPGSWAMVFTDDRRHTRDVLGIHQLTPDGLPLSKVFVKDIRLGDDTTEAVTTTACHELCEMLVDPALNLCVEGPRGLIYAYEVCDPCEEQTFEVEGVVMSDFVYPAWFEGFRRRGSTRFNHLGGIDRPFQLLPGGYISVRGESGWEERFGSRTKARRFGEENRDGHRATLRRAPARLRRSLELDARGSLPVAEAAVRQPLDVGRLDRRRVERTSARTAGRSAP